MRPASNVQYVDRVEACPTQFSTTRRDGALVLMLGAGNITDVAAQLAHASTSRAARDELNDAAGDRVATANDDRDELRTFCGDRVRFESRWRRIRRGKSAARPTPGFVESEAQLARVMRFCLRRKMPWFVLGSGANLLVGDGGIRGLVLRLAGEFDVIDVREDAAVVVEAGASASMALLTAKAASLGAVGIGSLAGIPGTVGGSLRMNAGTDFEMGDFVREVWVQSPSKPDPHAVSVQYYYRHTTLARDAVVSRVTLRSSAAIQERAR